MASEITPYEKLQDNVIANSFNFQPVQMDLEDSSEPPIPDAEFLKSIGIKPEEFLAVSGAGDVQQIDSASADLIIAFTQLLPTGRYKELPSTKAKRIKESMLLADQFTRKLKQGKESAEEFLTKMKELRRQ